MSERRYNANPVSNFMAWLGGARLDVLQDAPGDRARFVAMGGVILSTAFLSAVSAAFALSMAVGAPLAVAIIVGVFWGVIILNLDRLLIIGMAKQKGVWRNIGLAIPRVALALIIGTVISTPLTLQIFSAEINSEIQVMQAEDKAAFEERMASDPRFAAIPDLEKSIAANQAIVDQGLQTDLSSDPNYAAAVAATAAAQTAFDAAQAAYLAEIDGTGGTGIRGDGAVTQSKLVAVQAAQARLDSAKEAEAAALTAAQSNLQTSAQSRLDAATEQLAADKDTLAKAQDARDTEQAAYDSAVDNSAGLLSRLEALFRLGEANALLNVAHIMIALLFICIELLPVIVKVLSNLGVPTAYDRMVDVREDGEVSGGAIWASERARAIEVEAGVQVSVAEDRAARQLEFGKRVNQAVLEQQESVIERALQVWAGYAGERAEARMGEWERSLEAAEVRDGGVPRAAAEVRDGRAPLAAGQVRDGAVPRAAGDQAQTAEWGFAAGSRAGAGEAQPARAQRTTADLTETARIDTSADWTNTARLPMASGLPGAVRPGGARAQDARTQDAREPDDARAQLAELGFEVDDDIDAATGGVVGGPDRAAGHVPTRVPAKPVTRNADREAFLRRAGLPDQL